MMRRRFLILLLAAAGLTALGAGYLQSNRVRGLFLLDNLVVRVETDRRAVALTFDDGPTPEFTPAVLDILAAEGATATFFVTGREASENAAAARAIVADGHELANHSWSHADMRGMDADGIARELDLTDATLRAAGQTGDILFRPPYGNIPLLMPVIAAGRSRTTVLWDIEPESDPRVDGTPESIASYVIDRVGPGSIILLHVMYESRDATRKALPMVIAGLHDRGYEVVTVSNLLGRD